MSVFTWFLIVAVLSSIADSLVVSEIGTVNQNELFRLDDQANPKAKGMCTVHKTTRTWECILNCVIVIDEEDVQMRQHRFKSCVVARAIIRHMERNPFMAKHINMKFTTNRMDEGI